MIAYSDGDTSKLPVCWLVYYHKGEIKVKKGNLGKNFYPQNENIWHTGIPTRSMEVSSKGKVLCWREEDIPKAKQMILEHYLQKIDEVGEIATTALNNIKKMIGRETMITYENNCVQCEDCRNCGRKKQLTLVCDDCGDEVQELWYGNDGKQYCKYCITGYIDKVVIE